MFGIPGIVNHLPLNPKGGQIDIQVKGDDKSK